MTQFPDNRDNQPQGFGPPIPPSWISLIFNYKFLSIAALVVCTATIYTMSLKIENLNLKLSAAETAVKLLIVDKQKCMDNFEELSANVKKAAGETETYNTEIQDLKGKIDKYNKININNANILQQLMDSSFSESCEESVANLVDGFNETE